MKKYNRILLTIALSCIILLSCTKEGEQGITGLNGTNGQDGNANVVSSTAIGINWSWQGTYYSS
ncbi:MAG: hypothetical protein HRT73_14140, partial [Flavobacteriales bacterium]|nr:hypothetical protein [Flavobacteriales bacterium]